MKTTLLSFLGLKPRKRNDKDTEILFTKILDEIKAIQRHTDSIEKRLSAIEIKSGNAPDGTKPAMADGSRFAGIDLPSGNAVLRTLAAHFNKTGETPDDIARKSGLLPANINSVFSGKQAIGPKIATKLSAAYGFSKEYLLKGTGTLFKGRQPAKKPRGKGVNLDNYYKNRYPN
jgi:hypothetical protein